MRAPRSTSWAPTPRSSVRPCGAAVSITSGPKPSITTGSTVRRTEKFLLLATVVATETPASQHSPVSLSEPEFVDSFSIPDTHSPDDDKVYFFFKERAVEAGQWDRRVYSRVARVCKVGTPKSVQIFPFFEFRRDTRKMTLILSLFAVAVTSLICAQAELLLLFMLPEQGVCAVPLKCPNKVPHLIFISFCLKCEGPPALDDCLDLYINKAI